MTTYLITFYFTLPEKKYKSFLIALDKLGAIKVHPNAFVVKADNEIEDMRIALLPYLQKVDGLIIAAISGEVAIRNAMCSPETLKALLVKE